MQGMPPFIWVIALFIALDNYAQAMAARRRAGLDAPDASADVGARAWSAAAKGMRRSMLSSLFSPIGWMFMTKPFLVPDSTLGRSVTVLGGCLIVFGAVMLLSGASCLVTAVGLFRDAKRIARETQP